MLKKGRSSKESGKAKFGSDCPHSPPACFVLFVFSCVGSGPVGLRSSEEVAARGRLFSFCTSASSELARETWATVRCRECAPRSCARFRSGVPIEERGSGRRCCGSSGMQKLELRFSFRFPGCCILDAGRFPGCCILDAGRSPGAASWRRLVGAVEQELVLHSHFHPEFASRGVGDRRRVVVCFCLFRSAGTKI